jgi:hypothetical protein
MGVKQQMERRYAVPSQEPRSAAPKWEEMVEVRVARTVESNEARKVQAQMDAQVRRKRSGV